MCCLDVVAPPISSGSVEPAARHLACDVDHLVERRRDEPREADDVGAELERRVEDRVAGHHDAEVDDLVVVAAEHDADDVLADVVHVALDGREHDLALRSAGAAGRLLGLHERLEVRDRALHRARALDDLRQEHLARAEEVADDLHAVHQRPFDHLERPRRTRWRASSASSSMKSTMPCTSACSSRFCTGRVAPAEIALAHRSLAAHGLCVLDEPLGRIGSPVEDDVLDALEQVRRDVARRATSWPALTMPMSRPAAIAW